MRERDIQRQTLNARIYKQKWSIEKSLMTPTKKGYNYGN